MKSPPQTPPAAPAKAKKKKQIVVQRYNGGRPTDYNQEIAQAICEKIADGEVIYGICQQDGFPSRGTFYRWINEHEGLARAYALAKQCYAEDIFDDCIRIADAAAKDAAKSPNRSAKVRAAKLRIDTRFTTAARLAPRAFGERAIDRLLPLAVPVDEGTGTAVQVVEGTNVERHPLYDQMMAWKKAAKST